MPMQSESCSQWRFDPVLRTGRQGSGNTKDVEDLVKGWNLRRGLNLDSLACIACPSPPSPPNLEGEEGDQDLRNITVPLLHWAP